MNVEVTLPPGRDLVLPAACGCCGAPGRQVTTATRGSMAESSFLFVPVCDRCHRHATGEGARLRAELGAAAVAAAVWGAAAALALPMPLAPLVAASSALSLAAGFAAARLVVAARRAAARRAPRRGCTTPHAPVVETSLGEGGATFRCTNEAWARSLAELSGGVVASARPPAAGLRRFATVATALLCGVAAAAGAARLTHVPLFVDNGGAGPVDVYVDGALRATVAPTRGPVPERFWVRSGERRLAFAPAGSPPATARQTAASLAWTGALYNPGAVACHWREVYHYGSAAGGDESAPVPRREVIADDVDRWFGAPPPRIELRNGQRSARRSVLVRNAACTELARRGCSDEAIDAHTRCLARAVRTEDAERCLEVATSDCGLTYE